MRAEANTLLAEGRYAAQVRGGRACLAYSNAGVASLTIGPTGSVWHPKTIIQLLARVSPKFIADSPSHAFLMLCGRVIGAMRERQTRQEVWRKAYRPLDVVGGRAAEQQWSMIAPPKQMGGSRCGLVPAPSTLVRCQILAFDCPVARAVFCPEVLASEPGEAHRRPSSSARTVSMSGEKGKAGR